MPPKKDRKKRNDDDDWENDTPAPSSKPVDEVDDAPVAKAALKKAVKGKKGGKHDDDDEDDEPAPAPAPAPAAKGKKGKKGGKHDDDDEDDEPAPAPAPTPAPAALQLQLQLLQQRERRAKRMLHSSQRWMLRMRRQRAETSTLMPILTGLRTRRRAKVARRPRKHPLPTRAKRPLLRQLLQREKPSRPRLMVTMKMKPLRQSILMPTLTGLRIRRRARNLSSPQTPLLQRKQRQHQANQHPRPSNPHKSQQRPRKVQSQHPKTRERASPNLKRLQRLRLNPRHRKRRSPPTSASCKRCNRNYAKRRSAESVRRKKPDCVQRRRREGKLKRRRGVKLSASARDSWRRKNESNSARKASFCLHPSKKRHPRTLHLSRRSRNKEWSLLHCWVLMANNNPRNPSALTTERKSPPPRIQLLVISVVLMALLRFLFPRAADFEDCRTDSLISVLMYITTHLSFHFIS
eukprot:TRINITY_DN671_c0_g1_i10.p1 TRINITY_DN671_c0_g1~~TRINITY_DN671_c0_g1_i10.p1  ORF type:complete len:462 (-),score=60.11 TRINITY_DN671_c0_g1_i10:262-1647(-)